MAGRYEGVDSVAPFFVCGRRDNATRLVEHEVDFFGRLERLALNFDAIHAQADGSFRVFRGATVEVDFALAD